MTTLHVKSPNGTEKAVDVDKIFTTDGGTLNGPIKMKYSQALCSESNDKAIIIFGGGVSNTDGAYLSLNGKNTSSDKGAFYLCASKDDVHAGLKGTYDGLLTWGGHFSATHVILYDRVAITRNTDSDIIVICGGVNESNGSYIHLHGLNEAVNPGSFSIYAKINNNTGIGLVGHPTGDLIWGNTNLVEPGVVQAYAVPSRTPDGWLLCDGSAISRTTYARLFNAIGTTYGAGNGSTTFNIPNLINRFIEGEHTPGTKINPGVPNIIALSENSDGLSIWSPGGTEQQRGAIRTTNSGYRPASGAYGTFLKFDFNASWCSSIYGGSDTVQPPALTMRYIIKY